MFYDITKIKLSIDKVILIFYNNIGRIYVSMLLIKQAELKSNNLFLFGLSYFFVKKYEKEV